MENKNSSDSLLFQSHFINKTQTEVEDHELMEHIYLLAQQSSDNQNSGTEYINKLCLLSELKEVGDFDASAYMSEVFENIKEDLLKRVASYDIEDFQYDHIRGKTNIKLNIRSIKIIETPSIVFNNVQCSYNSNSHKIKLTLNLLVSCKGIGIYELDGIAGKYFPIRGNGNVSLEIKQLSGKADAIATFNGNQMAMDSLVIRFSIGSVNADFENLLDRDLSPVANVLLNNLAKPLVDKLFFNNKKEMERLMKRWKKSFDRVMSEESIEAFINPTNTNE